MQEKTIITPPNEADAVKQPQHTEVAPSILTDASSSTDDLTEADTKTSPPNSTAEPDCKKTSPVENLETEHVTNEPADASPHGDIADEAIATETTPPAPSFAEKTFKILAPVAPFILLLLLFAQSWMWLISPVLYAPCEEATLSILQKVITKNMWLAPMADNMAALPVYPWLAQILSLLPITSTMVLPLLTLTGAAFFLLSTWILGRTCGLGRIPSFAAGCLLLASLFVPALMHWLHSDLVTASLMACALAGLISGWKKDHAWFSLPLGFIFTALAGMSGGIIPFSIPLITSILFIFWTGRIRRAQQKDALMGFALMLIIPFAWVSTIILQGDHGNYLNLLIQQLLAPFNSPFWPPVDPLEQPILILLCALLPWSVLIFFVSWVRVLTSGWTSLKISRKENCGHAWLWIGSVVTLASCMLISTKPLAQIVIILPLAALLFAKALCRLTPLASRLFFSLVVVATAVCAITLALFTLSFIREYLPFSLPELLQQILAPTTAILSISGVLLIACIFLGRFTNKAYPCGALLVTTLWVTLLIQPISLVLTPALQGVIGKPFSPITATQQTSTPTDATIPQVTTPPANTPENTTPPEQNMPSIAPAEEKPALPEVAPQKEAPQESVPQAEPQTEAAPQTEPVQPTAQ